jgi:hypothetical protein
MKPSLIRVPRRFALRIDGKRWLVGDETDFPFKFSALANPVKAHSPRAMRTMAKAGLDGVCVVFPKGLNCIVLGKHLRGVKRAEVLLHEMMHACFPWSRAKKMDEESFVSHLAPRLLKALLGALR